ncbi:electron transfer flavoprotein subunit alpha/FixB family protein [Trueperella pecoris]|uniref:Electron transfer flavoprotein subunit alpha/FixB family protein n=1 Tax=Trueperella pecoris TaxID=2733571 RepID=A0A7M1R2G1_9ACTO|nr:electron transfer flavoprotein subunit alpha/FixB family protein [Trueperella pecoris]QOR48368.1 electron transfer flavoprotein subunit alpha/FixB family protein [Trueperella pecoris]
MTTWIVTTESEISQLVGLAQGQTVAVVVGNANVGGVDRVIRIATGDKPAEAMAPAVVAAVQAEGNDVVLVLNNPAGRSLAGAISAARNAPVLRGVRELAPGQATVGRFGGIVNESVEFDGPAVVLVSEGEELHGEVAEEEFDGDSFDVTVTAENVHEGAPVNLAAATRIVGVGRGFVNEEDLALARELADAIGAEVGCTRPLVEGHGWFDRDSYLGVSGHTVAPEVYIPVGVSGQIHHTAGIGGAQNIVVINNDETAAIFDMADYGIVGNLYQVLPQMVAELK